MKLKKEDLEELIKGIVEQTNESMRQEIETLKSQSSGDIANILKSFQSQNQPPAKKGMMVGQIVRALAAGKGDPERAIRFVEKHWKKDEHENLVKALAAGDGVAGGFTISEELSTEVIELLRPATTVRRSQPIVIPMSNGTFTMPGLASGAQSNYSGENQNGGITEPTFRDVKLTFKKLITLVPVSNDLLRYSSASADTVVRDDLVNSMAQREDLAFLRGDGAQDTPIGMRNLVPAANVISANATVNLGNVTNDLASLVLKLQEGNVRMIRPTWFMAPRTQQFLMTVRDGNGNYAFRAEMLTGKLWTWPFMITTQIPINLGGGTDESEIYLVDMADAIIGEAMTLTVDASQEAAYFDGTAVQAAFSKDQTIIRAIAEHDFNMRHLESIAVMDTVTWTP